MFVNKGYMKKHTASPKMQLQPFHLAIPVDNLAAAKNFYHEILGCSVGRSSEAWIDFDFFGHQLVTHLALDELKPDSNNQVDGDTIPVRHFGMVLKWNDWEALADRFKKFGLAFLLEPKTRFTGEAGEQGTFFVRDPAGNALEFKTFRDMDQLFAV